MPSAGCRARPGRERRQRPTGDAPGTAPGQARSQAILERIISGGQTGADRGALDACLAAGFPCGGFCPDGRRAEDGVIAPTYPLEEIPGGDYAARTRRNVESADGTAIFHDSVPRGGTALTRRHCERTGRPLVLVDTRRHDPAAAAALLRRFIDCHRIATLNVAGPCESDGPGMHDFVRDAIGRLLEGLASRGG